jgi:hypothetical protein
MTSRNSSSRLANKIGLLVPYRGAALVPESREVQLAAHSLGVDLRILHASTKRDFDAVFANLIRLRAGGLPRQRGRRHPPCTQ